MYRGIDVLYEIRKAAALIKGKAPPEAPTDPRTEITSLGFAGKLADGVLRSERLAAELPFLRIDGGGSFDLLQNLLDYKLQARLMSRPDTLDADNLADFEKAAIPVSVTGDAADPKIRVDLKELAKDAAVQKGKDRLLKKLGVDEPEDGETKNDATDEPDERDAARDLLKKGLRDLFN
jgi:AsmA protein